MEYGLVLPSGDARVAADLAREAEGAGWDGFFVFEPVWGVDAWASLAAAAMATSTIKLGTMLTPLPWIPPWKLAGQTATVDQLSQGRLRLAVGLGANDAGAASFGYELERKTKADRMDEGLDVLFGLWKGQPFSYDGTHYKVTPTDFPPPPPPFRDDRVPTWCVGVWPREKSMQRVLRCDGILPAAFGADGQIGQATVAQVREIAAYVTQRRTLTTPFDIVVEGETSATDGASARASVAPWTEAGATWWIETRWGTPGEFRERLLAGPPR